MVYSIIRGRHFKNRGGSKSPITITVGEKRWGALDEVPRCSNNPMGNNSNII